MNYAREKVLLHVIVGSSMPGLGGWVTVSGAGVVISSEFARWGAKQPMSWSPTLSLRMFALGHF